MSAALDAVTLGKVLPGLGWLTALILAIGGAVTIVLRQRPRMQELQNNSAAAHRAMLDDRIKALEDREVAYQARIDKMQDDHAKAIEDLRSKMEAKIEGLMAELRFTRHELADERASNEAMIMLLKSNPDKVIENLAAIEENRARKAQQRAIERGQMLQKGVAP